MKKYFKYLLLLLLTSCYNNLPEANISEIKITKLRKLNYDKTGYDDQLVLHFKSDMDLDSLRKNTSASMSIKLYCPLDGSSDFDIVKMLYKKHFIYSYIIKDSSNLLYNNQYTTQFNISEGDTINASSEMSLEKEEIINLLKDKGCIPCKFTQRFILRVENLIFQKSFVFLHRMF